MPLAEAARVGGEIHVVGKAKTGADRQRGHALVVNAALTCEAEELVEELLDAGTWGEGDADSRAGAAVRGPRVWGAGRYDNALPGATDGLLSAATQEDAAVEDLELFLLRTVDVLRGQERRRAQFEVHLGERSAGLLARPNERDPLPGDRVLDDITSTHRLLRLAATRQICPAARVPRASPRALPAPSGNAQKHPDLR